MQKKPFGIAAALFALALMLIAATGANAASLRINGAPLTVTGTAGTTSLIAAAGPTVTCTQSRVSDAVNADGTSTIAVGNATFGPTCRESILGSSVTVTQTAAWTNRITALLNGSGQITGIQVDFVLPARGVRLDATGCSFYVQGTQSVLIPVSTPVTPPALVSVSSLPFGSATLGLTIRSPSGILCGAIGISDGLASRFAGTYALSPTVSGTLL